MLDEAMIRLLDYDRRRYWLINGWSVRSAWRRRTTMARKALTELREEMRAVARGERKATPLPAAPLLAALSREALELLGVLLREHPATVTELVALTGRSQPNISRSLRLLARYRLLRLVREGRGVRPEPIAKALRVDLATGTYETTPPGAAA